MSHSVNNFFESLTNSTNPQYIRTPTPTTYTPPPTPVYTPPPPINTAPYVPFSSTVYKLPTTTYTPAPLRTHFEPLNSSYNNTFYNRK